jgi:CHAD domain-containing protein
MAIDADRIHKPVRKLRQFLKKSPAKPTSGEIHDLRTNSRRLETAVDAIGPRNKNQERVLRDLTRVRKRAGKIRDMDVLVGHAIASQIERRARLSGAFT